MKRTDIKIKQNPTNPSDKSVPAKQPLANVELKKNKKPVESSLDVERKKKLVEEQLAQFQNNQQTDETGKASEAGAEATIPEPLVIAQAQLPEESSDAPSGGVAGGAEEAGTLSGLVGPVSFVPGILGAVGLAGVAVASSGSSGQPPAPLPAPVRGEVIDGYLSGATVFIDENENGLLDANELRTLTNSQGAFTLPGGRTGPLVSIGGTDIATGLPFNGVLKAPAGATVITPLTTLMDLLLNANQTLTIEQAQSQVLAALGIRVDGQTLNLLTFDPVESATAPNSSESAQSLALSIQKAGVLVATLVTNITNAVAQATGEGASLANISSGVFDLLSQQLQAGGLSSSNVANVVEGVTAAILNNPAAVAGNFSNEAAANVFRNLAINAREETQALANQLNELSTLDDISNAQKDVLTNDKFTLQLLHFADAEAGLLASQTASRMAALVDRFDNQFSNTLILAGGDNFLPGPFLAAGTDPSLIAVLNQVTGSTFAPTATVPIAAADIAIH
ncbi:MAG TPA: hypothetical protein VFV39_03195, partial [Limnobacter sp.]|nr:hypothetical protein [Limnobacter sp.]